MSCPLLDETQNIVVAQDSMAFHIYKQKQISERFNCSFSLNERYREFFLSSELNFVGISTDNGVRIVELPQHRFFLAMLYQPQLSSSYAAPHPVVVRFLKASLRFAEELSDS